MKRSYSIALLLSTAKKLTLGEIAKVYGVGADAIANELNKEPKTIEQLRPLLERLYGKKLLKLIIDDSLLKKAYGELLEWLRYNYDSAENRVIQGVCIVTAMVTDGHYSIPITFCIWVKCDGLPTKIQLAQEIIDQLTAALNIKIVIADGLYVSENMINWLNARHIQFEMRFHSNRIINCNEQRVAVRECKGLKPKGKKGGRVILTYWHGICVYITAVKFFNSDGTIKFAYQVSNYKTSARKHIDVYKQRWNIEKFFRTAKQLLGLQDCASTKSARFLRHIAYVFEAYTLAQIFFKKHSRSFCNIEAVIHYLRSLERHKAIPLICATDQIFQFAHC